MRAFDIVDLTVRSDKRKACATLFHDDANGGCYRIEIKPWAGENDVPMLLVPFVRAGKPVLDEKWSRKWVEERIVPPSRQNIGQVLKANGLDEYDDFKLLMVSMGRCSQDDFGLVEVDARASREAGARALPELLGFAARVGSELARARREAGLTQVELSARSGVQQGAISRLERGVGNPTLGVIEVLAEALGVRLDVMACPCRRRGSTC